MSRDTACRVPTQTPRKLLTPPGNPAKIAPFLRLQGKLRRINGAEGTTWRGQIL